MADVADLRALADRIPFVPLQSQQPPSVIVYRQAFSNSGEPKFEGMWADTRLHIFCAGNKVRAQYSVDAVPQGRVGVFSPNEAFALAPSDKAQQEVKKYLRDGENGFRSYAAQLASFDALPLMATHYLPKSSVSTVERFREIVINKDGQWRLNAIREETLGKERCIFVQATHAKQGVSKWWLAKDRSYALVAVDHELLPGKFANVMNVSYEGSPPDKPLCKTLLAHERVRDKTQAHQRYELVESKPWAEVPGWFEAKSFGVTAETTAGMVVPGVAQSRYGDWPMWLGLVAVAVLLTLGGLYLRRRGRR